MIITREKGMRMWGGGSGNTSVSGASSGGGFSLTVAEGEGTGNAYTDFTYESGTLTLNKATEFVTVDFFNKLFTAYDDNGNVIAPNNTTPTLDNIKFKAGAWTEQYLSALGKNSESGGGGTGDVSHIKISSNPDVYLDPVDGIIDMSSYAATWNAKANSATTLAGYGITDAKITNGTTITLGSNSITPLTANSSLAWSKLTGTPSTLAGYGIGDAKISNGVITLGSATITPVTSVGLSAPTGFSVSGSPVTKTGTLTFDYASGYEGFTTSLKEKIEALYSWFEVDANGDVKTKDTAGGHVRGFYTESFVSALGKNSQGGSSTFDEDQMWEALGTDTTTKVIATSHIPDMASTYGYLKASALNGYATQTWVNQQGFVTSSGVTSVATGTGLTGGTITSTGTISINSTYQTYISNGNTAYGWGNHANAGYALASDVYSSSASRTKNYVLAAPSTANGAATFRKLVASDIPDLSSTYATDARADALEGYFNTGGVAKVAAKLNTGTTTYSAWGVNYWENGVPKSVSGNMTSVGNITPSANGNNLGTSSVRFNIYGTGGNFSGNVSITGTLGVTGAATLSSTLSVASGITLTTTKKIYFGDTSHYLELNSTGFHFSHGVYSDSFVSALGANSSGGGGGVDLTAVWASLTNTENPTYSTTLKINVNHIPDISSTYGYAKTSQLGSYLPLSGGTMSGGITISVTNKGIGLTDSAGVSYAALFDNGTNLWIGANQLSGTHHTGSTYISAGTGNVNISRLVNGSRVSYMVIDSGNYSSYALPLSGGTLTGTLTVPKIRINTRHSSGDTRGGIYYYNGTTDYLLIGQGSSNLWIGANETNGTHHTGGTYISAGDNRNLYVSKLVNNTRTNYTILDTDNTYTNSGKGYINGTEITTISGNAATASFLSYTHTNEINFKRGMQETCYFNFRNADTDTQDGGTTAINYKFCNYTRETAYSTVTAGTFVGAFSGNATTATTLQTSRTIWGESFNGSADVSGAMTGVTSITMSSSLIMANNTYLWIKDSNGTSNRMLGLNNSNQYFLGFDAKNNGYNGYIDANNLYLRCTTALYLQTSLVTLNAGARISKGAASGSILYIGDSNNSGWVCLQDICSQTGTGDTYWSIRNGGNALFKEVTATSDERRKNIISNTKFNVKDIASARSVLFEWKDDKSKKVHGGSIAQDWLGIADSFITEGDTGYYSLNYGALALCSAITIAKEVVKHENEITRLKKEVVKLRERVAELEERRA